jgi:hypothetical protein
MSLRFKFISVIIFITYPLVFKLNTVIPGFSSTDESYGLVWSLWLAKVKTFDSLQFRVTNFIIYPFGYESKKEFLYPTWEYLCQFLAIFKNTVYAYNIVNLLGFILSFLFTLYLIYFLTKESYVSFFAACIFSLSPYHFVRSWQHFGLAQIQWIPLCILLLLKLRDSSNFKNILFFALAYYLVLINEFSYAYIMLIVILLFCLFSFLYNLLYNKTKFYSNLAQTFLKNKKFLKSISLSFLISVLLSLPTIIEILNNFLFGVKKPAGVYNYFLRPFEDLFAQSARPLSYVLPPSTHPIFGKFTENFVGTSLYGESLTEHALYLGWIPLILAFVAFGKWRRNKRSQVTGDRSQVNDKESFYIGYFVFLAIVAWFFSQPPWWNIFGFKLYMPSFFMYKILPMFRAYCRFGIVVMLAVAVLAGFGLKFILERFKTQKTKIVVTTLFCGLVLFEFWNWPPYKVIDVSKVPTVYYWLKEQPGDFAIAEYPLDADSPNEMYKFFQTKHEKKIINGSIPGTYANKVAQTIAKLSELRTAEVLKWMGVKYALVHKEAYLETGLIEEIVELEKISRNSGLKFVRSFPVQNCPRKDIMCVQKTGPIDVYEVVASPIKPEVE